MTAAEVLALAKARDVTIRLYGNDLDIVAELEPDPDLLDAIAGCKPQLLAALRAERGHINRWIAARIVNYPADRCLHCRKPIIASQKWTDVTNGEAMARFHEACHVDWLAQQEVAARRAMGMME
jgi:hypothetical protein